MKPTLLHSGDTVKMKGIDHVFIFLRRETHGKPVNVFQCTAWIGLNGPEDNGYCTLSDYDVSRRCSKA